MSVSLTKYLDAVNMIAINTKLNKLLKTASYNIQNQCNILMTM
ncbi:protein of unknown function [Candidatus Nitrosocosmicus franklandus]|uniref:Uncharacterized protein n=1 Tax=Candidatus Nitrosocosmicus franklandianus TaxID=1798806 RepID=A0A484I5Z5_9ARCH|nr:protein of unknown function [Candidatus Nitrosocosmicus franklandus]